MSSEESLVEDSSEGENGGGHSSDSDTETRSRSKRKKLVRHTLPWRSEEFEAVLQSLDRKLDWRRNPKSKLMCLEVQMGGPLSWEKPDDAPEWATDMHHQLLKVEQITLLHIGDNMMYNDNIIMILYMFIIILIFKTCRQKCIN